MGPDWKERRNCIYLRIFPIPVLLLILFAMAAIRVPAYGETFKISGTGGPMGALKLIAEAYRKTDPDTRIVFPPNLGSSGAIKAVLAGGLDIAVSARPLKAEEERQGAVQDEYAITPFVFATGSSNKVSGYTLGEYAGIYAGTITEWPDGRPIRLILRPEGDSDTMTLRNISPEMDRALKKAYSRPGISMAMTDQDSADLLEKVPGAFGTTTLTLIIAEKRAIKPLSLNGVSPSVDTLKKGKFPFFKTLYLVTKSNHREDVRRFLDFVNSAEARRILLKTGHLVPERKAGD